MEILHAKEEPKKSTLLDLNDKLFEQLDRLFDVTNDEDLEAEVKRTDAVIGLSKTIIANAETCLRAHEAADNVANKRTLPRMLNG